MLLLYPLPNYGDHMTLEQWWGGCECGGFTDYDGYGYYAFEDTRTDIPVDFDRKTYEEQVKDLPEEKRPTHVLWFNK